MRKNILLLAVSTLVLAACSKHATPNLQPALMEPELAKPVQIVEIPQALPLPGQLQPEPEQEKADIRPPTARVDAANRAATKEPTRYGYINAIQVYPYTDGALYQLYAAPERVTDIMLQSGEKLIAISAGDTVRWTVGDTTSGTGESQQVHVLVKPFASNLKTNLVITTDRRAYHVQLESTAKTSMAALSWTYPQDQLTVLRRQNADAEAAQPVASNLALDSLHFHYEISGDNPVWKPLRAFDDGQKVYVEFPRAIAQGEAPPLFLVGADGGNELVNYHMRGNYYIVDRLFNVAELRIGSDPQKVVRIAKVDEEGR